MKQKFLLIITHGLFGVELLKSVEMIMGEQDEVKALGLCPGDSVDDLRTQAEEIILENKEAGKEVIVMADILGGSPSNIGIYMLQKHNVKLLTGVNMLMVIEYFSSRDMEETDVLLDKVIEASVEGTKKFQK